MIRRNSRVNRHVFKHGRQLLIRHFVKLCSVKAHIPRLHNADFGRYGRSCGFMVTRYHNRLYSGSYAIGNRRGALGSGRVGHSCKTYKREIILRGNIKLAVLCNTICKAKHSHSLLGKIFQRFGDFSLVLIGDRSFAALAKYRGKALAYIIRRALCVHYAPSIDFMKGAHQLSVTVKRHLGNSGIFFS